ncbi:hypothetical protein [Brevibacillus aydinogluensis]|uniref:PilZ domain-containing protein n=1 Tax=Brevibacillus aydinogluensis TaxID=927786 RepID=A0AA48RGV6_9BACL|nr:hypothetical protein [Brevibacillus aydinogluensis]CAJ1002132.1 PilZ domain-containing protein [Brevibacillus aydinogluensis]
MDDDMLEAYLDRNVRVHFAPGMLGPGLSAYEEGKLHDYGTAGLLLEAADGSLTYIPYTSVRMVQIKPRPGFWERLTGTS